MKLDSEQQAILDYEDNAVVIAPPGCGKTAVFCEKANLCERSAAFIPFTRAARAELEQRIGSDRWNIKIATINSFCQSEIEAWPGSYELQLSKFLEKPDKEKYDLVGIDEVQDLLPAHFEIAKAIRGDKLFAGGDPNQTIFSFGGAEGYAIFDELRRLGCKTFYLHNNYRSNKDIVDLLNHVYPREIIAAGPQTYNRSAIFARTHERVEAISKELTFRGISHHVRGKDGTDWQHGDESGLYAMCLHQCKGLGFDKVFMLDWQVNERNDNMIEECNLIYVSIARASKEFYLVGTNRNKLGYRVLYDSGVNMISVGELTKMLEA